MLSTNSKQTPAQNSICNACEEVFLTRDQHDHHRSTYCVKRSLKPSNDTTSSESQRAIHAASDTPSSAKEWRASRQPTIEEVDGYPPSSEHHNPDQTAINRLHTLVQFKKLKMIRLSCRFLYACPARSA
jgi:hypothetical protein